MRTGPKFDIDNVVAYGPRDYRQVKFEGPRYRVNFLFYRGLEIKLTKEKQDERELWLNTEYLQKILRLN